MGNTVHRFVLFSTLVILGLGFTGCIPPPPPKLVDSLALHIQFDYNKATIKDNATEELDRGVKFVKQYPGSRIKIAGHTDNIGNHQYNQNLSEARALVVRDYLVKVGGVEPDMITTVGYRDLYPVAPNQKADGRDNPQGRAMNRRVEIQIYSN